MQHEYTIVRTAMVLLSITLAQCLLHATVIKICNLVVIASANHQVYKRGDYRVDVLAYTQPQQWKLRDGMARFALALAAIVILTLSAGPTHDQPQAIPLIVPAISGAAFHDDIDTFRAELMPMKRTAIPPTAQRSPNEELPEPALLVYLALILVGSAGSVLLARRRLHGKS
jgi:hypothetical protein